jgi:hypothetical protein
MTQKRKEFRSFVLAAFVACALGQTAFAQRAPSEKPPSVQTDAQRLIPVKAASEQMDPEEFRRVLMTFTALTGAVTQTSNPLPYHIAELSAEEMQAVYDVFPAPRTFSDAVQRLGSRTLNRTLRTPGSDQGGEGSAAGIIGVLAPCESFDPAYPEVGGLLDFLTGLGLTSVEEGERCLDDDVEVFVIAKIAAEIAAIIAQALCDNIVVVFGEGFNTPFCVAAGIANGVKAAAQVVLDACQELTNQVDSAEIEAGYENTKIIIDALCCVPVDQQRKIQGCNGQDDDCDGTIDECDEDTFGPDVFVDPAIRGQCFKDAADALTALRQAIETSDDCGNVVIDAALDGAECDVEGSVTVTDDCLNDTGLAGVGIRIDGEAPTVTCSVTVSTLFPPNLSYTDVGFSYTAVDNCSGDLTLEVKVTSDEQTTLPPGIGKSSPFPDAAIQKTIDGTVVGVLLRNERGMLNDGRVYAIHVFATDSCGNVGTAACTVSVLAVDSVPAVDSGQYYDATGIN